MEFNFNVQSTLCQSSNDSIVIIDGSDDNQYSKSDLHKITSMIDHMGFLSAKAQNLGAVITTANKFFGNNQRLYIKCDETKCLGILKVGKKKLFIYTQEGKIIEMNPLCVLDFYVHESCQRSGFGKELFMKMLQYEKLMAMNLGYDRPSEKLMSFLKKHFNLTKYVPQNNNYVVFNDYFESVNKQITPNQTNYQQQQNLYQMNNSYSLKQFTPIKVQLNKKIYHNREDKENNNNFNNTMSNSINSTDTSLSKHKTFASFKKVKGNHSRSSSCNEEFQFFAQQKQLKKYQKGAYNSGKFLNMNK